MFVLCLRYANSREDAEDILQEGFVSVFRDLNQYNAEGSIEGWIRKVILNSALQYIRRQKKFKFSSTLSDWEAQHHYGEDNKPFDKVLVEKILHLFQKMPPGFRTVLNLYIFEGCTHQEIATELNITVGTSKSQLSRAKRHLKKLVDSSLINNQHY